jgi:hypothetical protein
MNKEVVCYSIVFGAALLTAIALLRLRLHKEMILSGFLTGLLVAGLNMLVEYLGARYDVYYVSGPWVVLHTPLPLAIGWVFITFLYCTVYGIVIRDTRGKWAVLGYVAAGIIAGCMTDFLLYRFAEIVALGKKGTPYCIVLIWLIFVPLTIFLYEFFMGLLLEEKGKG